jgi:hypothetical protein
MNRTLCRAALPVLFLSSAVAARAEVNDCTPILSVPTTITLPGVYCLTSDLNAGSATAILVDGPLGVVIDLNGHTLQGEANGTGLLVRNARRVTLRNGSVVGFSRAVQTTATAYNTRVEDLTIMAQGDAITIDSGGWGDVIQRNWIERGNPVIRSYGHGVHIADNNIVLASSGIDLNGGTATVEDNRVSRSALLAGTFGIRSASGRAFVSRNNVAAFSICFDLGTNTRYRENVTVGCTNTYTGGVSAGNNY